MALIDSCGRLNDDRRLTESEWTEFLVKHGYAEFAASDPHYKIRATSPAASSTRPTGEASGVGNELGPPENVSLSPAPAPSEGLSARRARVGSAESSQARPLTAERRISLEDWAARLTGKRTRKQ